MQNIIELARGNDAIASALKYVLHHNKSNNAPYHNFFHTSCVAESGYDLALKYCSDKAVELALAGLFHDFDHSQGKLPDNVNVRMALEAFSLWSLSYNGDVQFDSMLVERCIISTQYPYTVSNEKMLEGNFIPGLIIRDADMMQCLHPNWMQQVLFGLGQEFGKNFFEMVDGQIAFLDSLQPNTEYLKDVWLEQKPNLLKSLRQLQTYNEL